MERVLLFNRSFKPNHSELYRVTIKSHFNCKIILYYKFVLQLNILIEFHFTNNKLSGFGLLFNFNISVNT